MTRNTWIGCSVSGVMALIVTGLLLTPQVPNVSLGVPFKDKAVHAVLFFAIAFPAMLAVSRVWHWPIWAFVVGYGGVTELVQPSFGRSAEWADLAADAVGAALAVLVARRAGSETAKIPQRQRTKADHGPRNGKRQ